jgi:hypothetical protein
MGEIASEQNSTIILPIPLDLFRPYLGSLLNGDGASAHTGNGIREEEEAERLYEEAVGDIRPEAPAEDAGGETGRGEERS